VAKPERLRHHAPPHRYGFGLLQRLPRTELDTLKHRTHLRQTAITASKSTAIGILTLLATTACHSQYGFAPLGRNAMVQDPGAEQTFVFECDDGFHFTARTAENTVWLFLPGQAVQLPRVRSESGTRYASSELSFWSQGEAALLKTKSGSNRNCQSNAAQAVWEHAKLDGVDFRATGNEPGWDMEITLGDEIVLVTDYGQSSYRFKTPEPDMDQTARKTTYTAHEGQQRLIVELEGKPCLDSLRDQSFEITVAVKLDERQFHGCGKALH